jgi:hypothetical protein
MSISLKKAAAAGLALALGLSVAGFGASAASAAVGDWTPDGTPEPYYLYSMDTGEVVPEGTKLTYDSGVVAAPSLTDPEIRFAEAPADAESVYVFIAPRGKESSIFDWSSKINIGIAPGSNRVLQPTASFSQFPASTFAAVKSAGGDYSLGFAYTKNNGVTFVGLGAYTHVHLTPGTADWTFVTPKAVQGGGTDPGAGGIDGTIGIEAPVAGPVDGALSLAVPTGAKATLGAATLDVDQRSISSGTLPTFSVSDERYVSKPGWTLETKVADFVSGSTSIPASALSIAPVIESSSTSTGVTKATGIVGSNSRSGFADAAAGVGTGKTDLSAALSFVAPQGTPAGTYTSTMTVTLISK